MRRFNAILVLFSAVLLAGCQAGSDSASANEGKTGAKTSANDAKGSGGILRILRPDPITVPEGATLPLVLETAISSSRSRSVELVVARLTEDD